MKKTTVIVLSIILFALLSCGNKKQENKSTPEDSLQTQDISTQETITTPYNAVIIGKDVRSRELPDTKSKAIRNFAEGEMVTITDRTVEREVLTSGDDCDESGYQWFRVKDHNGVQSWVFGKFIYAFSESETDCTLSLNGASYRFIIAEGKSMGPDGEEGLNACEIRYIPLLYQQDKYNADLVYYTDGSLTGFDNKKTIRQSKNGILILSSYSGHGSEEILEAGSGKWENKDAIHLKMGFYSQTEESFGSIYIMLKNSRFTVAGFEDEGNVEYDG